MAEPVPAVYVANLNTLPDPVIAGSFCVNENGTYFLCVCPCGCGSMLNLPICTGTKVDRAWLWDGNREKPTLSPSIKDLGGCFFHGVLTQGVWTFTGDSGVAPQPA
jgi:hypothetical protein